MTTYGITAKVLGMYKEFARDLSTIKYYIVAKSDEDDYLTITLINTNVYESYGRYGIMFTSHVDIEIDIDGEYITEYITHFPINEHYLDLNSIIKYSNEEIHELKCEIFEVSRFGKREDRRSIDGICPPRGEIEFNENLFLDFDIKKKKKYFIDSIKGELLAITLHPDRINNLLKQNIKIGELNNYI